MERLLGFDPQLLFDAFVTGINVFILFFALSYLLFNTVRDVLERRRQKIAGELKSAADDKEAARAMKEEYQTRLTLALIHIYCGKIFSIHTESRSEAAAGKEEASWC